VLNKKITVMKENPDIKLRIIGNTCDLGNGINIMLGLNRAEAVKKYMENNGIPESRLVTATQGKNDPMVPNNSEDNRKLNRRCDFEVIFK
jgi:outer membrane protein OmpA-like peptidoglycan-associated protein